MNKAKIFFIGFKTAIGLVHVMWGQKGLLLVSFPDGSDGDFVKMVKKGLGMVPVEGGSPPGRSRELLKRYFSGKRVDFADVPLDLAYGTEFQRAVWRKLMEIPYGEVRSYGWVAKEVGCPAAPRAVGRACGQNPLPPIVPCHRVVGTRGELVGYSGLGGVNLKKKLLELERAVLKGC